MNEGERLRRGARRLGIEVDADQAERLLKYRNALLKLAARVNLTAILDPAEALELHLIDSLSALRVLNISEDGSVVDVGSGGGLPGVPLGIMRPGWRMVLIDSSRRRVNASLEAARTAGAGHVEAVHGRAEDLGQDDRWRHTFDGAVSRALAPLPTLLEYCIPFLKVGGRFVAMKGPGADEEIASAHNALAELESEVESVDSFTLPFSGARRSLIVVRKKGPTPPRLPRRAGVPGRRPL